MPAGRLQILKVLIITYVVVFGEIPRQLTGPFTAVHMGKSDSPAAPVSNKRANPNPLIAVQLSGHGKSDAILVCYVWRCDKKQKNVKFSGSQFVRCGP
jgi:hypothetical protein